MGGTCIKLTIKNQTVHFSIRNVLTQNSGCNNVCTGHSRAVGLYTVLLFAYHDQLFNVFFYKAKAKQTVISIFARPG